MEQINSKNSPGAHLDCELNSSQGCLTYLGITFGMNVEVQPGGTKVGKPILVYSFPRERTPEWFGR